MNRFGGIQRLYGKQAFSVITAAHICVIGIGGVGSWAAEALARSAVGQITLIDMDDISHSNINRQLHALDSTQGQSKVTAMQIRIADINPDCHCHAIDEFISLDNLNELLSRGYDYVIDACDSVKIKAAIINWCQHHKLPLITIGGAGGQKDPSQIAIKDLIDVTQDPLISKLRSQLRRYYGFRDKRLFEVECVYSNEQLVYPQPDGTVSHAKSVKIAGTRMDCDHGFGAATFVTGSFAFTAVAQLLDKLVKRANQES